MNVGTRSSIQMFSVLIGAIFSSAFYVFLRINVGHLDSFDKFWCALPLFASMIVTNRCIIGRLVRFMVRRNA